MHIYECRWDVRQWRRGRIIWELLDKKNLLVDEGERMILDIVFRNGGASYFPAPDFYAGFYNGNVSETTVLASLPNEPSVANGYSRQVIERSSVGWPTIEKHDGDWRVVSKTLTWTASGGNIGPINGSFLGTSNDNSGTLVGSLTFGVERTIIAGDSFTAALKTKLK